MRGNLAMLEQQNAQKTENLAGGIAGALIGSLLGVVCIVLLSQLGYVAAISGVLMAVGVLKGYEKLGGKLTKKGIVISMIIMVFMTYAGDRMDWAIRLLRDAGFGEYGLCRKPLQSLKFRTAIMATLYFYMLSCCLVPFLPLLQG